ncbi:bifunctional 2-polyprenyl-6-hydroxyphenol methylase/3-demethylubiquinol 3-O-methyltransferase UbiG [Frankia sp. R43]|uniref:class I SAM-dependent methyltransferase n=1 Tax=Frankia sp. R43 TaxID=269536 RepID=UPI0006CA465E|nr:class I SAM-dependent methyltransferase [Frankia sp. R43]
MPYSSECGKAWITSWLAELAPASVLDIGAGAGGYARICRQACPAARLTAVEIWEPYVARFGLASLYDEVLVGDARTLALPAVDVVILGDVLEHMIAAEAVELWARARAASRLGVLASLPVVPYPQGAVEGNPHEEHRETWSHARVLARLPGVVASDVDGDIGVYLASPTEVSACPAA